MSRSAMKKADLVSLATDLGIDTNGMLKHDIDSRIMERLAEDPSQYSEDPRFQPFLSPTKRRRTTRRSPGPDSDVKHSPELESDSDVSASGKTTEGIEHSAEEGADKILAVIQAWGDSAVDAFWDSIDYAIGGAHWVRARLSTVCMITTLSVLLELGLVLRALIPFDQRIRLGDAYTIRNAPDLSVLQSCLSFWRPLLAYLASAVIVPSVVGYFINFKAEPPRKNRRKSDARPEGRAIDPLVFAITKVVLLHLALTTRAISVHTDLLKSAVGDIPYGSAVVGILLALYTN